MDSVSLRIEGTSCERCVQSVQNALRSFDGVQVTLVHACSAQLQFDPTRRRVDEMLDQISDEGFAAGRHLTVTGAEP